LINIRQYTGNDKNKWDRYVREAQSSCLYHLIGWKEVIEKTFEHKTYYILAENEKREIIGILPLVHQKSILFGNFMISVPYFNYGGLCVENDEVRSQLLTEAIHIANRECANHIELRHTQHIENGLHEKTAKVSMRLELPGEPDDLWKNFPSKLRSQVKRPQKEGMYSTVGSENELDSFYSVFTVAMRDLGTPVYPKKFFKNILMTFPDMAYIQTVYTKDDIPIASGFLVGYKKLVEIPWAASLRSYNRYSPNMLLYWESLKYACENGYSYFDFGRSTPGEGTYRFKKQWGAKPLQLYWHYWLKDGGTMPELNPNNPKYKMAIKIWQRLPLFLTNIIGPAIVKNLP